MLDMNSRGDGYPGNWVRYCDTCKAETSTLYCHTDSAYLCNSCDERYHAASSMALPHECVWIFTAYENETAAFTSRDDAASFCVSCDADIHLANPLAHRHVQIPETPFSGLCYAASSTYQKELPDIMLHTENEIAAPTTLEAYEDETEYWLLLEPDKYDIQTNIGFTYSEELNESFGKLEYNSRTESRCQDQKNQGQLYCGHQVDNGSDGNKYDIQTNIGFTYGKELNESFGKLEYNSRTESRCQDQKNQGQLYCGHQVDNGSDGIVPVQSFEEKGQEERRGQQQPQQQNVYFNGESESSKSALINNLSSSQSVPMSGILPKATVSDMSRSYTRYPQGTTGLFPNFSFLMPLQLSPTNREAKVLRYREKRKARKFEKKIRYASRKAYAEARPRVKGRFARKTDMDFEVDEMFSTEDLDYGIVPSF